MPQGAAAAGATARAGSSENRLGFYGI